VYESQRLDNYAVAVNVKSKIESDILHGREYDSRTSNKEDVDLMLIIIGTTGLAWFTRVKELGNTTRNICK
jgi:hypothetical protein